MIIKKGFFTKLKYEIDGHVLRKSKHSFFGLFHRKAYDESIKLTEVKYIYLSPLKKYFYIGALSKGCGVEFVSQDDSLYIPCLTQEEASDLITAAKNAGAEDLTHDYKFISSDKSFRAIYKGYSILCEQFGQMVHKVFSYNDCTQDLIRLESIKYFDEVSLSGVDGIAFGGIVGGGIANSIEIFGLSKEDAKKVYDIIVSFNPKLGDANVTVYKSKFPLFNPKRWFAKRENLIVADWGIVHKQYNVKIGGKKTKVRTSVVEYDSIKSYISEGFISKRIQIFGETSIVTKEKFGLSAKTHIWDIFDKKDIYNDKGECFRAWWMYRWRLLGKNNEENKPFLKAKIIASSEFVTWKLKKEIKVLSYEQIYKYEFKKPHWYSFVGHVEIRGRRLDARSGEGSDVVMDLRNVCSRRGKKLIKKIETRGRK